MKFVLMYWNSIKWVVVDSGTKDEMFARLKERETKFGDSKDYMVAIQTY